MRTDDLHDLLAGAAGLEPSADPGPGRQAVRRRVHRHRQQRLAALAAVVVTALGGLVLATGGDNPSDLDVQAPVDIPRLVPTAVPADLDLVVALEAPDDYALVAPDGDPMASIYGLPPTREWLWTDGEVFPGEPGDRTVAVTLLDLAPMGGVEEADDPTPLEQLPDGGFAVEAHRGDVLVDVVSQGLGGPATQAVVDSVLLDGDDLDVASVEVPDGLELVASDVATDRGLMSIDGRTPSPAESRTLGWSDEGSTGEPGDPLRTVVMSLAAPDPALATSLVAHTPGGRLLEVGGDPAYVVEGSSTTAQCSFEAVGEPVDPNTGEPTGGGSVGESVGESVGGEEVCTETETGSTVTVVLLRDDALVSVSSMGLEVDEVVAMLESLDEVDAPTWQGLLDSVWPRVPYDDGGGSSSETGSSSESGGGTATSVCTVRADGTEVCTFDDVGEVVEGVTTTTEAGGS